jgi:hypothetical protein
MCEHPINLHQEKQKLSVRLKNYAFELISPQNILCIVAIIIALMAYFKN